jgi:membrane fusion protein (multidrug efflux system)
MAKQGDSSADGAGAARPQTVVAAGHETARGPHVTVGPPAPAHGTPVVLRRGRRLAFAGVAALAACLICWRGVPWIQHMLTHVSTDDAFVAGDSTSVASRIGDVVDQVLVRDYDFVEPGSLLVSLDKVPFRLLAEQRRADLVS